MYPSIENNQLRTYAVRKPAVPYAYVTLLSLTCKSEKREIASIGRLTIMTVERNEPLQAAWHKAVDRCCKRPGHPEIDALKYYNCLLPVHHPLSQGCITLNVLDVMADKKQRLVLSILDFLAESMNDGTVKEEDKEGLEVAGLCLGPFLSGSLLDLRFYPAQSIGEAFGIDPTNEQQRERLTVKPANLQSIFDVYLKTRDKVSAEAHPPPKSETSPVTKAQAERLKQQGNSQMSRKEYAEAIQSYTEAIALDATNAVYYSNRAAAHSSLGDHQNAIDDAEKAIETDPKFVKAFSRLG